VTGTGFLSTSSVRYGPSTPATFTVVNDTTISVVSPPHAVGLVNVWVTNHVGTSTNGSSSWFSYKVTTGPPPTVTGIAPNNGSTAGGTAVTITGSGFTGATLVRFGSTSAAYSVVNDSTITVTTPAHAAALVNVFVTTQNGTNVASSASRFNYH
jgi:hypothetical protein